MACINKGYGIVQDQQPINSLCCDARQVCNMENGFLILTLHCNFPKLVFDTSSVRLRVCMLLHCQGLQHTAQAHPVDDSKGENSLVM
jgi:hypothetical protein